MIAFKKCSQILCCNIQPSSNHIISLSRLWHELENQLNFYSMQSRHSYWEKLLKLNNMCNTQKRLKKCSYLSEKPQFINIHTNYSWKDFLERANKISMHFYPQKNRTVIRTFACNKTNFLFGHIFYHFLTYKLLHNIICKSYTCSFYPIWKDENQICFVFLFSFSHHPLTNCLPMYTGGVLIRKVCSGSMLTLNMFAFNFSPWTEKKWFLFQRYS